MVLSEYAFWEVRSCEHHCTVVVVTHGPPIFGSLALQAPRAQGLAQAIPHKVRSALCSRLSFLSQDTQSNKKNLRAPVWRRTRERLGFPVAVFGEGTCRVVAVLSGETSIVGVPYMEEIFKVKSYGSFSFCLIVFSPPLSPRVQGWGQGKTEFNRVVWDNTFNIKLRGKGGFTNIVQKHFIHGTLNISSIYCKRGAPPNEKS
jgi:hypothetical protein